MACFRQALTFQEKDSVRAYKQHHPEATQHQCRLWFFKTYNKKITQSTISEILSKAPTTSRHYLNKNNKKSVVVRNPARQRKTSSKYSELDTPLYMTAIKLQESGTKLTFPLLQQLAVKLWPIVYGPQIPPPHISVGMMQRFADRNDLKISRMRNTSKANKTKTNQIKFEQEEEEQKPQPPTMSYPMTPMTPMTPVVSQPELLLQQQVPAHIAANTFNPLQQPQYQLGQYVYSENVPGYSLSSSTQSTNQQRSSVEYPDSPCSLVADTPGSYSPPPLLSPQNFNPYLQYTTAAMPIRFQPAITYNQAQLNGMVKTLPPLLNTAPSAAPMYPQTSDYLYYNADPSIGLYSME